MSERITNPEHFMCRPGFLAPRLTYVCWKCGRIALTRRGALRLNEKRCKA